MSLSAGLFPASRALHDDRDAAAEPWRAQVDGVPVPGPRLRPGPGAGQAAEQIRQSEAPLPV